MSLTKTIYEDAFSGELNNVWSNTPFKDELQDLSLKRALNSMMRSTSTSINERRDLLYSYLKPAFSVEDTNDLLNRFKYRLPTKNTLFKRIIRNLCNLYGSPEREIDERLQERLQAIGFDNIQKQNYEYAKASGEIAIRPYVLNEQLHFYTYNSDTYRYKTDDFGNITEFWIAYTVSRETNKMITRLEDLHADYENRYQVWDSETKRILDENLSDIEEPELHGYGRIPFEVLSLGQWTDFQENEENSWNLAELQLLSNQMDLLTDENLIYGTLGTWLATNLTSEDSSVKLGSGRIVWASHRDQTVMPPTLEYITAESEYLDLRAAKESIIKEELKNFGLPSAIIDSRTDLSGIAMKLDRMELDELRGQDKPILEAFEHKLFKLIGIVSSADGLGYNTNDFKVKFDTQSSLSVEELEYYDMLYAKGFISLAEYGRKAGMSGTDEEILQQIEDNKGVRDEPNTSGGDEQQQPQATEPELVNESTGTGEQSTSDDEEDTEIGTTNQ